MCLGSELQDPWDSPSMSPSEELLFFLVQTTSLADLICVFQSLRRSQHKGQSWSNSKSQTHQTPRWVLSDSFKVVLADAQAGKGVLCPECVSFYPGGPDF